MQNVTLAYEVDDILVVEPHEVSSLLPIAGNDFVTLIICTPYAINSHRLLIRGYRVPYEDDFLSPINKQDDNIWILWTVLSFLILLALCGYLVHGSKSGKSTGAYLLPSGMFSGIWFSFAWFSCIIFSCALFSIISGREVHASAATTGSIIIHNMEGPSVDGLNTGQEISPAEVSFWSQVEFLPGVTFHATYMQITAQKTDYIDMYGEYYQKTATAYMQVSDTKWEAVWWNTWMVMVVIFVVLMVMLIIFTHRSQTATALVTPRKIS